MKRAACVIGAAFFVACLAGCGNTTGHGAAPSPSAVSSPKPDAATEKYLALIRNYWTAILTADELANGTSDAIVCLGNASATAQTNLQLIDPTLCRELAVGTLAVQQKFLRDLDTTPAPPRFATDDTAFRNHIPKAIAHTGLDLRLRNGKQAGDPRRNHPLRRRHDSHRDRRAGRRRSYGEARGMKGER